MTVTSLKAGPVPAYSNPAGLPFIPNPNPLNPANPMTPVAATPPAVPGSVAPTVLTADTNCAYGSVRPTSTFARDYTSPPNTGGNWFQNTESVYVTDAPQPELTLNTQAGATTDYCLAFRTTAEGNPAQGERVKNNVVTLPVGAIAEIDTQVKCTEAQFDRHNKNFDPNTCPPNSQVGTATIRLAVPGPGGTVAVRDSPGKVFALETPAGQAGRLGLALYGGSRAVPNSGFPTNGLPQNLTAPDRHTKLAIDISQQGSATVGLINTTDELAKVVPNSQLFPNPANPSPVVDANGVRVVPIQLHGAAFRFWGSADAHPHGTSGTSAAAPHSAGTKMATNFFRMPTTCQKDLATTVVVNPYTGTEVSQPGDAAFVNAVSGSATSAPVRLTGCEGLGFDPSFKAEITGNTAPGAHVGLKLNIDVPEGNDDLGATKVTLPTGIATDLNRIQNACLPAAFEAQTCDPKTIIGAVSAEISGINAGTVKGDVHMVKVEGETLPALGLNFKGRLPLRVSGITKIDSSGRIVNTFADLPSIPQRSLSVELFSGDKGILVSAKADVKCAVSALAGTLTSQNGKTKSFSQPTVCKEQFKASIKGADTKRPTIHFSGAGATGKKVQSVRLTFPKGLTIAKNRIKRGSKIDKLEDTVKKAPKAARISKKSVRFTIGKPGSNGMRIQTRKGALNTSSKFRSRDNDLTVVARVVYTDGTKSNTTLTLDRK